MLNSLHEVSSHPAGVGLFAKRVVVATWREHGLAIAIVATQLAIAALAGMLGTESQRGRGVFAAAYLWLLARIAVAWLVVLFAGELALARVEGRHAWNDFGRGFARRYLSGTALVGVTIGVTLFAQSAVAHDAWKSTLGTISPYVWDPPLHAIDVAVHGGVAPWRLLEWVFRWPAAIRAIDAAYAAWYPLMMIAGAWILWTPHRRLRQQFFIAWVLKWVVLGAIMAHLVASAGPAFSDLVVGAPDPYADLMARLRAINQVHPLNAIYIQDAIRDNVLSGGTQPWLYMSAMPSLHVAVPALFALALMRVNRWVAGALWAYVALIMIGSVVLGWHYAIDGYVSLIGIVVIWYASGWLVRNSRVPEVSAAR